LLIAILLLTLLVGCTPFAAQTPSEAAADTPPYTSFRDIPGVTAEEIAAIEALQTQGVSFVYGTVPSTETYIGQSGDIEGFTALFCDWMSELFGLRFTPKLYEWDTMLSGLESGEIDFTGELTATPERRAVYRMTDGISERRIQYFRIADSAPLNYIAVSRSLRFAFLSGTVTFDEVTPKLTDEYETTLVNGYEQAYQLLTEGKIDAFIDENTGGEAFDRYGDVVTEEFYPLIYMPVSLTTQKQANQPIIAVVQKILQNGGRQYLSALHHQGENAYKQNKLRLSLTGEELAYLETHHTVNFVAEYDNYPISFYNHYEKEFQGICFDVLKEAEALTGMRFTLRNDQSTSWADTLAMLQSGEASLVSELIRTDEREGQFIWPKTALLTDHYTLISKSDFRQININEVQNVRVAIVDGYAPLTMFRKWFPDHQNAVIYDSFDASFDALARNEVDMVMAGQNQLLVQTNFRELPGYKANLVFDYTYESTFGFNKDETLLCSIMDKALRQIDTKGIAGQWTRKTYDYTAKMAQAQLPWLYGVIVLLVCVVFLIGFALLLTRRNAKSRRLAAKISAENEALDSLSRMKTQYLANISHEMKTPLTVISVHIQQAAELFAANESPETVRSSLDYAQNEIMRVARLSTARCVSRPCRNPSRG
jgi:ABC-type amino acid transport substrate-binding protein